MSTYVEMKSKARRFCVKIGWTFVGILLIIEHIYMISYIAGVQSGPRENSNTSYDGHNIGKLGTYHHIVSLSALKTCNAMN